MQDNQNPEVLTIIKTQPIKKKKHKVLSLLVSGLFHLALLFIAYCIVSTYAKPIKPNLILITSFNEGENDAINKNEKRSFVKEYSDKEQTLDVPINNVDEIEKPTSDTKESSNQQISDLQNTLSNENLVNSISMGSIATGNHKGAFSNRNGEGKIKSVLQGGGSKQTELAVDAALNWLKRQQENDGHWDKNKFGIELNNNGFERRKIEMDSVLTALATMAFISAGNTPTNGKYSETVKKSVQWILQRQLANGSFGESFEFSVYNNSLCSIILSELSVMCPDQNFKQPAQKAIDYLGNQKTVHEGFSDYSNVAMSTSVNGWLLMAIKSAKIAGLNTSYFMYEKFDKRLREITTIDQNGEFQFVNYMMPNDRQNRKTTMTAVGMLMYEYLGYNRSDLKGLADTIIKDLPEFGVKSINQEMYRWYYTTLALFQFGGEHWKTWNTAFSNLLVKHQRIDGPQDGSINDLHGSWDCETDHFGQNLGRIYTTAMTTLCLEVYYRYNNLYSK